jgi:hypothetical protein
VGKYLLLLLNLGQCCCFHIEVAEDAEGDPEFVVGEVLTALVESFFIADEHCVRLVTIL